MKNLIKIILVSAMLYPALCFSDAVYFGGLSKHLATNYDDDGNKFNSRHFLIAYETDKQYIFGYYDNSFFKNTYFAGKTFDIAQYEYWNFKIDLTAIVMVGYEDCFGFKTRICAGILPGVTYTKWRVQPTLKFFGDAAAIGVKYNF